MGIIFKHQYHVRIMEKAKHVRLDYSGMAVDGNWDGSAIWISISCIPFISFIGHPGSYQESYKHECYGRMKVMKYDIRLD